MISMKVMHRADATHSTHYYAEQKDDYYSSDGNSAVWQGKGAFAMGLSGEVDPERFKALLRGDFGAGITVAGTVRRDAKARAGMDLTFSAPKSVTLQALVAGDGRVVAAHDKAVEAALAYVERELAMGRIKIDGQAHAEQTGNLVIAKFRHETARPTKHSAPDPQLHTHAIIMNITQRKDGSWVSLSNEEIVRLQRLVDAHYMSELAAGLENLGYGLRFEANHIELDHYTRAHIEAFSKRSMDINRALHQLGLDRATTTHEHKAVIALQTRMPKDTDYDRQTLQSQWKDVARSLGMDLDSWKEHGPREVGLAPAEQETWPSSETSDMDRSDDQSSADDSHLLDTPYDQQFSDPEATGSTEPPSRHVPVWPSGDQPRSEADREDKPLPNNALPENHEQNSNSASRRDYVAVQAMRWAIKHLAEREAVMSESHLLAAALRHAGGRTNMARLQAELQATVERGTLLVGAQAYSPAEDLTSKPLTREAWISTVMQLGHDREAASRMVTEGIITGRLVSAEQQYTTAAAHQREIGILEKELHGRDVLEPIMDATASQAALADEPLTAGQREAVKLVLETKNRIIGVQGLAGTGKSHMLDRARRILDQRGFKMVAVASYGSQVRALRELGVEGSTIASRLEATNKRRFSSKIDEKTVLVVDEAGVVPSRLMERLIKLAEQTGARLLLLGDTGQTPAIEAGKPFAQMQQAGMATAGMRDIIRQKNPALKVAVELAAAGRAKTSLSRLNDVIEIEDATHRYQALAERYAQMSPAERAETLIVTGTNASRNAINDACREARGLTGQGQNYTLLTRRDTTQAERRYAKYYSVGDIIQPERDYAGGLKRGELYQVVGVAPDEKLRVEHLHTGEAIEFSPARTQKLSIYEPIQAELAVGDWVRVTRNDAAKDLANGDRAEVRSISSTEVVLAVGGRLVSLPADAPLHLDRAYATTVHSAQGLTCDRVLINAESFSRTTKSDVFYVSISRARHEAIIYTNDSKKLPAAVARREDKSAALDLVPAAIAPRERQHPTPEVGIGR
ncbi:MAG: MobF family relaxase [Burkholderiaceae bacterium]